MNYHGRIMNTPMRDVDVAAAGHCGYQYKVGHRDARHAAAEIANEADALVAELLEALEKSNEALIIRRNEICRTAWALEPGETIDDELGGEIERMESLIDLNEAAIAKAKS